MTLSVIIVSYNERPWLAHVLSLLEHEFPMRPEVIVVDNASSDKSDELVRQSFPWVKLKQLEQNIMYGPGNNCGLDLATGELVMILNPDVDWKRGELQGLVEDFSKTPATDLAAPQLRYSDGRIQASAHRRFPNLSTVFVEYCLPLQQLFLRVGYHPHLLSLRDHTRVCPMAHATGVCLLVRRTVIDSVGKFDPEFSMYLEETDWQYRMAAAGFTRWLIGSRAIVHFGSAQKTFGQASAHYLWGLRRYADKHWPVWARGLLKPVLWLAAIISLASLAVAWPLSVFSRRARGRVSHYLRQYGRLIVQLLHYPRLKPAP